MFTKLNAIKVCKLLYICAIIYDFFFGLKIIKINRNFLLFHFICIQLNFQKLQTSAHTDAAPDARLFSHLVRFSKRSVILILSKTYFRYQCNVISLQLFNLIFDILSQITPPPPLLRTYNSVHIFEPFQNPNFASNFFPQ